MDDPDVEEALKPIPWLEIKAAISRQREKWRDPPPIDEQAAAFNAEVDRMRGLLREKAAALGESLGVVD